jgi:hypothetical protein
VPAAARRRAAAIAGWLARNPAARMVVIDVFAKVRGRAAAAVSAHDADYAAIGLNGPPADFERVNDEAPGSETTSDLALRHQSGRRESNPHDQLGS